MREFIFADNGIDVSRTFMVGESDMQRIRLVLRGQLNSLNDLIHEQKKEVAKWWAAAKGPGTGTDDAFIMLNKQKTFLRSLRKRAYKLTVILSCYK